MSLTEREKEIALECAMKGDLCVDEGCLVVSRGDVLDMFDDFLSRIREEQEAVAWLHHRRHESDVITTAVKHVWGKAVVGAMGSYSIPLFTIPPAAPDAADEIESLRAKLAEMER